MPKYVSPSIALKKLFLSLVAALTPALVQAQDYLSFESGTASSYLSASSNVTTSISGEHYKFGTQSLKVEWDGTVQSKSFTLDNVAESISDVGAQVFWIYSANAHSGATAQIQMLNNGNNVMGSYTLNMDFTGWRAVYCRASFFGTLTDGTAFTRVRFVFPDATPANTIHLDGFDSWFPSDAPFPGRFNVSPDFNFNGPGAVETDSHWNVFPAWQIGVPADAQSGPVTQSERDDLNFIISQHDISFDTALDQAAYDSAVALYDKWITGVNADGSVAGTPLFFATLNYGDSHSGGATNNFRSFGQDFQTVVRLYRQAESQGPANFASDLKQRAVEMARFGRDQGFALGSIMGNFTLHGYHTREWGRGLFYLRDALADAGMLEQVVLDMEWLYTTRRIFDLDGDGVGVVQQSGDDIGTTASGRYLGILMNPDQDEAVRYLRYFRDWVDLVFTPGFAPMKPNGEWWHHGMMLPLAYHYTQLPPTAEFMRGLQQTDSFRISESGHARFRETVMHYLRSLDNESTPMSLRGRGGLGNFNGTNVARAISFDLAKAGSPDRTQPIDLEMAEQYTRINGGDPGELANSGVTAKPLEGNWNQPYGALSVHRRDDWKVVVKGHSRYDAFGESLGGTARWNYYSHGTIDVINEQSRGTDYGPVSGWDWARYPGTTVSRRAFESNGGSTTNITYDNLNLSSSFGSWARSNRHFVGGLSHHEKNGCHVMQVAGYPSPSSFYGFTDTDMQARKGTFFFDDRVISIGSDIRNTTGHQMETILIQSVWNAGEEIAVDGSNIAASLPSSVSNKTSQTTLLDQHNIGYYIPAGQNFNAVLRNQSPEDAGSGDMFQAWLNHGSNPSGASYEYATLPDTTASELAAFATAQQTSGSEPYIVRANTFDHQIVWDRATNTTGYIIYPSVDNGSSNRNVTYTPFSANDLLVSINESALLMLESQNAQTLLVSVADPDLDFTVNANEAPGPVDSQVHTKTLTLKGLWKFSGTEPAPANVTITGQSGGNTIIQVDCQHGSSSNFTLVDSNSNNPPLFSQDVIDRSLRVGETLNEDLTSYVTEHDAGDSVTYSKEAGPAWLSVSSSGALTISGTPVVSDRGANVFTIRATDTFGGFNELTLNVQVIVQATLAISESQLNLTEANGLLQNVTVTLTNTGDEPLDYTISDNGSWLSVEPATNGDFERGTNNGGGVSDVVPGWTYTDILDVGDHGAQGYQSTGSFTAEPATDNGYYHLGRSSQISQVTSVTMTEGVTYRLSLSLRRLGASFGLAEAAFTDAAGNDLVFSAVNSYSANLNSTNGETIGVLDTENPVIFEASFTAGPAQDGQLLGLRIASTRTDSPSALVGVDDVRLTAQLGAGQSVQHTVVANLEGEPDGIYNATVTFTSDEAVNSPLSLPVEFVNGSAELSVTPSAIVGNNGEVQTVDLTVSNTGTLPLDYAISDDADWLSVGPPINGDFERGSENGGGAADDVPGWTFSDILDSGDNPNQGFKSSGSFSSSPATDNGFYNLGRSSQISQVTSTTMIEGMTYRLNLELRRLGVSYGLAEVAFTDGSGTDLVFTEANAYSSSVGVENGGIVGLLDTENSTFYEASFTATAAQNGLPLGIRIASVRTGSVAAIVGVDNVSLRAQLGAGQSIVHTVATNFADLPDDDYTANVTFTSAEASNSPVVVPLSFLFGRAELALTPSTTDTLSDSNGAVQTVNFTVGNTGTLPLEYTISDDADWLSVGHPVNGDFERGTNNGGGAADNVPGWTFADILDAGDSFGQGYTNTGSFTAVPAVDNGFYNLGRSSQISQVTSISMIEGRTYRLSLSLRRLGASFGLARVAFTDGSGTDLVFVEANAYTSNISTANGDEFGVVDTENTIFYEASFTASAAQNGQLLGLRIASTRTGAPAAFVGVDDVRLRAQLGGGESHLHSATANTEGLSDGTYNAVVTVSSAGAINGPLTFPVEVVVGAGGDSDSDGILDAWELQYSGSTTGLLPNENTDGDLYTNIEEYIFGLNPTLYEDTAPLSVTDEPQGDGFQVDTRARANDPNLNYTVSTSETLTDFTTSVGISFNGTAWISADPAKISVFSQNDLGDGVWQLTLEDEDPAVEGLRFYQWNGSSSAE